jgi:hypothetical protein
MADIEMSAGVAMAASAKIINGGENQWQYAINLNIAVMAAAESEAM